jgi:hypothetical protein
LITHQDWLWIVPEWLVAKGEQYRIPARMICIEGLDRKRLPIEAGADFALREPIPPEVMDGTLPPERCLPLIVIDRPDVRLAVPTAH